MLPFLKIFSVFGFLIFTACAPKVYVIDRTSILEEEAGGAWPDLETAWKAKRAHLQPEAEKSGDISTQQKRLTRTLEPDQIQRKIKK